MEPSTPLSRDSIVETALRITRSEGLDAVTMRALGKRLGVTPMALYRHIGDRDELIRLTVDRIGALVRLDTGPEAGWEERVRTWALAQHDVLRRHPGVAAWLMDNGPAGGEAYRLLDLLAAALAEAGFDDGRIARGSVLVMSWTFSRVAIEDNADERRRARRPRRSRAFIDGLGSVDPSEHPTAARIGPEVFSLSMNEIFETGLDWIIAGLGGAGTH